MNTPRITRESLEKSLELAAKATLGPWEYIPGDWDCCGEDEAEHFQCGPANLNGPKNECLFKVDCGDFFGLADDDAAHIAHNSPEFIKALVKAHLEALDLIQHITAVPPRNCCLTTPTSIAGHYEDLAHEFLSKHGGVK